MDNKLSAFITLDEVVKQYLIDIDAVDTKNYNRAIAHAMRGYNELEWDVLKKFTARILPVDSVTKTVTLPEDFVQYTRIGFKNQVGEVIDLTYDPNLVTEITAEDCHCNECGCNDEVCAATDKYALTKSEIVLPTEQKVCDYATSIEFTTEICDYRAIVSLSFPLTLNSYVLNGETIDINVVCNNASEQEAVLVGIGLTKSNPTTYTALATYDYWTTISYTNQVGTPSLYTLQQISCTTDNSYYGFPFTVTSLLIDGETSVTNKLITTQQEFEDFFEALGFDVNSTKTISATESTTVYTNVTVTDNKGEETTIYFFPRSCTLETNDVTYEKKVTTCLSGDKVTKETCAPVLINSTVDLYDYSVDFGGALGLPTEVLYNKDGQEYSLGTIDTLDELYTELIALGWGLVSYDDAIMVLIGSENIWGDFEFVDTPLLVTPDTILEYQSVNVVEKCSTEIVCELEVLECGCIVPTDEVINTLYAANLIDNAMFQRYINGGEISTTWRQPMNAYGFYNVDVHKGIIKLDPFFRYDAIYLEYYTSSRIQSKDFLVPVLAREYLISYMHKMSILRKNNAPLWQIEKAQKQARAEKHNLRLRWQPIRYREIVDLFRTTTKS
jgi:hypothetical protein